MNDAASLLNSFPVFFSLSVTIGLGVLTSAGMALFSGFDARASNVKVDTQQKGQIGCRTLESWGDNAMRLRLVYRELYLLKAIALIAFTPFAPVIWSLVKGEVAFGWLPFLALFAISLQVLRSALDNRLKAVQA